MTDFPDEVEDKFRKGLYDIFDLKPLELLVLQGIMRRKTLQDIADELTDLFERNNKSCTRFHVFQLRKSMMNKMPQLKDALLTEGQRKELKP